MKFIHLSDLHLLPQGQAVHGIEPHARLDAAVSCIRSEFADAEFCVVTGDLSDAGDFESYNAARQILDCLPCPWHALRGNHDARQSHFRAALPDLPWQADGSLQFVLETSAGHFIALDSSVDGGVDSGNLTPDRLADLRVKLGAAQASGKDAFLFMHHVPFDVGIGWLDGVKLQNGVEFWETIKDFSNIRHMFFGHIHRPSHGSWHGVPFSTVRATAHQVMLTFGHAAPDFIDEAPSFAVVIVTPDQVVIHDHDFLKGT